jgi:asparagine synthase (glutamine-hydrolysing)
MCGIAGIIDLAQQRPVPDEIVRRMAHAIVHRGPDEEGFFFQPGVALASRRLSIVGLADGQQPVTNEDGSVVVVFNGELFDHLEKRAELEARGHRLVKHCDTEVIPHLWEEHQRGMFERLRGQFAIALWDQRERRLLLGRDRFGICPLYWTRQGDWLLFASEIKALLASGMVPARPDRRGIDHIFTFSALPGPITCFEGVQLLRAGHFLEITPGSESGRDAEIADRAYWKWIFPILVTKNAAMTNAAWSMNLSRSCLRSRDTRLKATPSRPYLSAAGFEHDRGARLSPEGVRDQHLHDPRGLPGLDKPSTRPTRRRHIKTGHRSCRVSREDAVKLHPQLIQAPRRR